MTVADFLIIFFGMIIVIQCFFMYLMSVRIRQLLAQQSRAGGEAEISESELDELTKSVEEFKRHQM